MRCVLPLKLALIVVVAAAAVCRGWNVVCFSDRREKERENRQQNEPRNQLQLTITRCVRRIVGLASGEDISSTGAIHCSMNSLSERANDG